MDNIKPPEGFELDAPVGGTVAPPPGFTLDAPTPTPALTRPNAAAPAPAPSGLVRRAIGDTAVDLGKGVIGVGEAVVGLADIPTFGLAGKAGEAVGWRPEQAKDFIGDFYSPERKAANAEVEQAEGFIDTAKTMLQNPSTIVGTAVESAPLMLGGGAVARGVARAVPALAGKTAVLAGIGEGAVGAGAAAEQIRQQTADGELTGTQVLAALGAGGGTGLLGALGGKVADKLGIADPDVLVAGGTVGEVAKPKGLFRRALEGAVAEGVLEEAPQSAQEQVWTNVALDRPLGEGVPEATAAGMLAGGLMGGGVSALTRPKRREPAPVEETQGQAAPAAVEQPKEGRGTISASDVTSRAQAALDALNRKAAGTPEQQVTDDAGVQRTVPAVPGQFLSDQEKASRDWLSENIGNPKALADRIGLDLEGAPPAAPVVPNPGAAPGTLADAANAIAATQAPAAPAPAPVAPPAAVEAPAEAAVAPIGPRNPPPAPWLDTATGEITKPTAEQVTAAMLGYLSPRASDGQGIKIDSAAFAAQWGIAPAEVKRAHREALQVLDAVKRQSAQPAATETPEPAAEAVAAQPEPVATEAPDLQPAGSAQAVPADDTPAPAPQPQEPPVEIRAKSGGYFKNVDAANRAATQNPGYDVRKVARDAWVLRRAEAVDAELVGEPTAPPAQARANNQEKTRVPEQIRTEEAGQEDQGQGQARLLSLPAPERQPSAAPAAPALSLDQVRAATRMPGQTATANSPVLPSNSPDKPSELPGLAAPTPLISSTTAQESTDVATETPAQAVAPAPVAEGKARSQSAGQGAAAAPRAVDDATYQAAIRAVKDRVERAHGAFKGDAMRTRTAAFLEPLGIKPQTSRSAQLAQVLAAVEQNPEAALAAFGTDVAPQVRDVLSARAATPAPAASAAPAPAAAVAPEAKAKALDRVARGSAYFGTQQKADDFIAAGGIADTHAVVQTKPGRFEVQAKPVSTTAAAANEESSAGSSSFPKPDARGFVTVKTVYGDTVRVSQSDLDSNRELLLMFDREGNVKKWKGSSRIHRENLDPDGSKAAKRREDNGIPPYIGRVGVRSELDEGFATPESAMAAVKKEGYSLDDFEPKPWPSGGFVAVRKEKPAAATANVDLVASAKASAPTEAAATEESSAVESLYGSKGPLRGSVKKDDLDGFKAGDRVKVLTRTTGDSTVEMVFTQPSAVTGTMNLARIVAADGKKLDVLTSEIERIAADQPTVDTAAQQAATSPANDRPEPTEAQKKVGNYKVGHVVVSGLDISIENEAGTRRRPEWPTLASHYGYIKGTIGKDKDHVDVFIKPGTPTDWAGTVFVVDQRNKDGSFDEHKVMLGFDSIEEAKAGYLANYTKGWTGLKTISATPLAEFKAWVYDAKQTVKPFASVEQSQGPAKRKQAEVIDNGENKPGEFIVRDAGTNLATFEINASGAPVRIRHFYEAAETRQHARDAIEAFVGDRDRKIPEPDWWTRSTGAMRYNRLKAAGLGKYTASTPWSKLSASEQRNMDSQWGDKSPNSDTAANTAPEKVSVKTDKAEIRPYRRPDGSVGYEAIPIYEAPNTPVPKQAYNEPAPEVATNASTPRPEPVSGERPQGDQPNAAVGDANREPLDAGVAEDSQGAVDGEPVSSGTAAAGARGTKRPGKAAGNDAPGATRDSERDGPEPGAADAVTDDFDLADEDIGSGGLAKKYRDNIAAIKIIKALEAEGRKSTADERKQLSRYVGWGALKGVFDPNNKQWGGKQHDELKALLTPAEYAAARASQRNAHFTSKPVVAGMIRALQRMGFTRGRLLEPSVGVGNFFGMLPANLRKSAQLYGVELDPITSKIAAGLYPNAKIVNMGFQDYRVPGGFFDAAIGNPPFGDEPIVDMERSPYSGQSIHNYFFAKTIDKLRDGGLMTMVVSRYFMDRKTTSAREWIADRANLISAVRLPRTAFLGNAGTEVVTDVLVFQKRGPDMPEGSRAWVNASPVEFENGKTGAREEVTVNDWYTAHPNLVLGKPSLTGSMRRANEYTVEPTGDLDTQMTEWADSLPANIHEPIDRTEAATQSEVPEGLKVGNYFATPDGKISMRLEDVAGEMQSVAWVAPNAKAADRLHSMIKLRDLLRNQMRMERSSDAPESEIEGNRKALNKAYDAFLKEHGHLNAPVNRRLFVEDPDSPLVQSLEFDYDGGVSKAVADREGIDQRAPSAVKADIFTRRVMFPQNDMQEVTSAKDAMIASMNYRGTVDLSYMAAIYNKDEAEIERELGDLVFRTPDGDLVTADDYLSGDVKTKLADAQAAVGDNPDMKRNVEALKAVIPKDKTPSEIHVAMNSPFLPGSILSAFVEEVTGYTSVAAAHVKTVGQWVLHTGGAGDPVRLTQTWGTARMSADDIIKATLMGRAVVVTDTHRNPDGSTTTTLNEKETEAAREKQTALRNEFKSWLWRDGARGEEVLGAYNEKMNRTVQRSYDGAHLSLPGKNPGINLLAHQLNGVWRGLQSRQILLDHVVGAGKTFQMVAMAMEMRRLGIARKPVFIVPNHLTLQWKSEFSRLYPGSNVLAATPDDFAKDMRPKLFSKIVTGDWDAVILGHSSLKRIGLPPEIEGEIIKEQIDELSASIEEMKRGRGDRNIVRDMEGIKARLEARAKERLAAVGARDKVLTFDELGHDALFVDELHEFKNLQYTSTMTRVPGMGNPAGSARGFDLFLKTQWLFRTFGDKAPLVTATGTPVSNSLVEMFNVQRYMQYPSMKEAGTHIFDAWAAAYGSVESLYEVAPSGSGFRASSRFAKFQNLGSLMGQYMAFADVVTLDDLKSQEEALGKRFPVPKIRGGRPTTVIAQRSQSVADFMGVPQLDLKDDRPQFTFEPDSGDTAEIVEKEGKYIAVVVKTLGGTIHLGTHAKREDAEIAIAQAALTPQIKLDPKSILGKFADLRRLTKESKGKVNALSLTGEANKAGLDYRLINPSAPDFPGSKVNLAADNIIKVHAEWKADRGTQLVFLDMSVPLSARAAVASKPKRAYVRNPDGTLTHKRATLHAVDGAEFLPYLVAEGKAKSFDVYDATTGHPMYTGAASRAAARQWAETAQANDDAREAWIAKRSRSAELDQEQIDAYNDENEIDVAEVEALSLEDIIGISGSAKFSVYDDLRAKLIAKGIPESEIAFIHDYDTPAAKSKLFAAVNRGDIRVLMGSTPKMGAGTNVQQRAVALHHIDAPWRPSDLEQREGRIIRRGNHLYDRDPEGFEVQIFRYATEQTYDARRWQILEHKARGIEQLRNYDGTLNEIEDIDGEAANAADMKAAASGDPLILRETQLRNEVKRLETLEVAHADNAVQARRAAQAATTFATAQGPRRLKEVRAVLADVKPAAATGKVPAGSSVAGKKADDRDGFQAKIAAAVGGMAKDVTEGRPTAAFEIAWRGIVFEVSVHPFIKSAITIDAPTGQLMNFQAGSEFSALGLITRMNNYIDRLPSEVQAIEADIVQKQSDATRFIEASNKPFELANELVTTREEYRRVQRTLMLKGPNLPKQQKAILETGLASQRDAVRKAGFGAALDKLMGSDTPGAFSKANGRTTGTPIETVRRAVSAITTNWQGDAPRVQVLATAEDLPASAKADPDYKLAEGYYDPATGTVYLVAPNLRSTARALEVLAHEAIGHYGMEAITGPQVWAQITDTVGKMRQNPKHAALFAEIGRRYGARPSIDPVFVREAVAVMAEKGVRNSVIDRVVAALRALLRRLGFNMAFSEAELRQQIVRAARHVERGGQSTNRQAILDGSAMASARPGVFYSAMVEAIAAGKGAPKRADATAWKQWLDGAQRRGEFKQGEREWLGVDAWLTSRAITTREELAEFIRANQVQLQDVVLSKDTLPELPEGWEVEETDDGYVVLDEDGEERGSGATPEAAIEDAMDPEELADRPEAAGMPKFAQYQLPGGQNYRELLLTLPEARPTAADIMKRDGYIDITNTGEVAPSFMSTHFDHPNIIAHVRFNERTDADGKRVLFVEEVQSDWHQQGRKRGYDTVDRKALNDEKRAKQAKLREQLDALREKGRAAGRRGEWRQMVFPEDVAAYESLLNEHNALTLDASTSVTGIPDAPLKKEWPLTAMKRMLRWAVDNGFDRLAWTTGDQQFNRYPEGSDTEKASRLSGMRAFYDTMLPNELAKYVKKWGGKVGQSSIDTGLTKQTQAGGLTRDQKADLRDLAKRANDMAFDEFAEEYADITGLTVDEESYERLGDFVRDPSRRSTAISGFVDSANAMMKSATKGVVTVHSLDITQAMREAALDGQPLFAKPDPAVGKPTAFSGEESTLVDRIAEALRNPGRTLVEFVKNTVEQWRPAWLGALSLRHLAELGQGSVPFVGQYADIVQQIATDRNVMQEEGAEVAERWQKWAAKNRAQNAALVDLMHDATIAGTDPAEAYADIEINYAGKKLEPTRKNVIETLKAMREQIRGRSRDDKTEMFAKMKLVKGIIARNKARRAHHAELAGRWQNLSPEAKAMYREVRDLYAKRRDEREKALIGRIRDQKLDGHQERAIIDHIRQQFEAARVESPYFPLQRFGDFWIAATSPDGEGTYIMRESHKDWLDEQRALKQAGFTIDAVGRKGEKSRALDGASAGFVTEVITRLKKSGAPITVQDEIYQMYLQSLPDLSQRKHSIHRKKVAGYSADAIRAFGRNMLHEGHQIARMRYSHQLEGLVNLMGQSIDARRKEVDADPTAIAKADALVAEMKRRHEWIMNPTDSQITNAISSLGFIYYLGATPAAALVNLTQTAMTTFPALAAHPKVGHAKAMNLLMSAMTDSIRTGGHIQRTLTDQTEQRAYQALRAMGAIDKTQAHNLAGIAEGDSAKFNPAWAKTMNAISLLFHKAEVVNREASGMAAFRAATGAGMNFDDAVKFASDTIQTTHFDYANANRARWMQGNIAKTLLMFRQYSLNMTWFLARNAWQSWKGETPAVRKQALRTLTGTLGMTAIFSGTLGLPVLGMVFGLLNAAAASFGGDDEPWDAETEFRNFLADLFGTEAGAILADGPVNAITGADIAGRVSLNGLWFRDADRELEGRDAYFHLLEQAAGPVGGIVKNMLVGKQLVDQGQPWRGVETMLPKSVKDAMKGARYATEGVNNLRGDAIVDDLTPWQSLLQLSGFTPAEVSRQYDANRAIKGYEKHILDRRQRLIDAFAMSVRVNDADGRAEVLAKIRAFNTANPEIPITMSTIERSLRGRARYSAKAEGGIVVNKRLEQRARDAARFAAED